MTTAELVLKTLLSEESNYISNGWLIQPYMGHRDIRVRGNTIAALVRAGKIKLTPAGYVAAEPDAIAEDTGTPDDQLPQSFADAARAIVGDTSVEMLRGMIDKAGKGATEEQP